MNTHTEPAQESATNRFIWIEQEEQITEWASPDSLIETVKGFVSYRHWCNQLALKIRMERKSKSYIKGKEHKEKLDHEICVCETVKKRVREPIPDEIEPENKNPD